MCLSILTQEEKVQSPSGRGSKLAHENRCAINGWARSRVQAKTSRDTCARGAFCDARESGGPSRWPS
eukprot:scaffold221_cov351-Pavlova_lutheri.AAC.7